VTRGLRDFRDGFESRFDKIRLEFVSLEKATASVVNGHDRRGGHGPFFV